MVLSSLPYGLVWHLLPLVLSSLLTVLAITSIGSPMVVVCWVDGCFPTSCMVNEVHAFFNGMGAGILLTCLVVLTLCAGFTLLTVSSFFGQRRLVAACPCPQFTHFCVRVSLSLHWADACRPAQYLQVWTSDLQVLA